MTDAEQSVAEQSISSNNCMAAEELTNAMQGEKRFNSVSGRVRSASQAIDTS
jgi:hypothetical protein